MVPKAEVEPKADVEPNADDEPKAGVDVVPNAEDWPKADLFAACPNAEVEPNADGADEEVCVVGAGGGELNADGDGFAPNAPVAGVDAGGVTVVPAV